MIRRGSAKLIRSGSAKVIAPGSAKLIAGGPAVASLDSVAIPSVESIDSLAAAMDVDRAILRDSLDGPVPHRGRRAG